MHEPLILAAGRSPFGARHGRLAGRHPAELLAAVLEATLERAAVDPADVDEVLVGCATPVGAQAANLAGQAVRAFGRLPPVPATVVSTQDSSSLMALIRAVDAVRSGRCGMVLVGGVESMSTVPAGADMTHRGFGLPAPPPGDDTHLPPGPAAEGWATRHGVDRERLEAVARRSRSRASRAQAAGGFAAEMLPAAHRRASEPHAMLADELVVARADGPPQAAGSGSVGVYSHDGLLTAATVAPMADGAAAAVVASPGAARRWGGEPLARVVATAAVGGDPRAGCGASPTAAARVLAASGLRAEDVRRVELAELFATSVVHWDFARADLADVVNPDGGSLALGHPQGATGLGLVARLGWALAALPGEGFGVAACDAVDGHGVAVLLGT